MELSDYKPDPKRCTKCQDFRHTRRFCIAPAVCAHCSEPHLTTDCKSDVKKCVNCGLAHYASSWDCKRYKTEAEVEAIREKYRLTYRQADSKIKMMKTGSSPVTTGSAPVMANSWGQGRSKLQVNQNSIDDLKETVDKLKQTVDSQANIIKIQSRLIWLMVYQSKKNLSVEVTECLKMLSAASTQGETDGETDESEDDEAMEATSEGKPGEHSNNYKRKERESVADAGEEENSNNSEDVLCLSRRERRRIAKKLKESPGSPIHKSLIPNR